ncbi:MAG: Lrp/AsnC family transcriptional regulator [Chthoniobacter sp.]
MPRNWWRNGRSGRSGSHGPALAKFTQNRGGNCLFFVATSLFEAQKWSLTSPPCPRPLDEQEKMILKALVRDPRESDNAVGLTTGVNVRTVSRKRQRLEEDGILSFYANVELGPTGTNEFPVRQLYTIKFRLGMTMEKLLEDIRREPKVRTVFTESIIESHVGGDGRPPRDAAGGGRRERSGARHHDAREDHSQPAA